MNKCKCGSKLEFAPGIGEWCTNKKCPEEANFVKQWKKQWKEQRNKLLSDFVSSLQGKMHYHQYPFLSDGMQGLLETEIEDFISKGK